MITWEFDDLPNRVYSTDFEATLQVGSEPNTYSIFTVRPRADGGKASQNLGKPEMLTLAVSATAALREHLTRLYGRTPR